MQRIDWEAYRVLHGIMADAKSIRRLITVLEERMHAGRVPCVTRELEYLRDAATEVSKVRGLLLDLWGESSPVEVTK